MEVLVERCAGLDVGKDEVVGCVRTPVAVGGAGAQSCGRSRRCSGLEALADWLTERRDEVVMEATGSYWKPVW